MADFEPVGLSWKAWFHTYLSTRHCPTHAGLSLPLEAYAELVEVTVGQLLLAACDNALLPGNVAGTLSGLPRVSDPQAGLNGVADTWARELGFRGPAVGEGAGGGGGSGWGWGRGRGPSPKEVAEAKARAVTARKEVAGQLRLAARMTLLLASHIDQRLQDTAAPAAGGAGGDSAASPPELELLQQEVLPLLDAPGRREAHELLRQPGGPGAQPRRAQGKSRGGGAEAGVGSGASVAPPSAGASGLRLRAIAQRVLLAAGAAYVSLELQESVVKPQRQQQKAAAERQQKLAGGGPVPEPPPLRGGWPAEASAGFRDACTLLQARVAPACFQPATGATDLASVAQAADALARLSQRVCYPSSRLSTGMRLVGPDANREYEGLSGARPPKGPLALLFQAAQAKMQLPKAAADAGIGGG